MRYLAVALMWGAIASFLTFVFDHARFDRVILARGASSSLVPSFSYTNEVNLIGGVMWREGRPVYIDGAGREITRDELIRRLTPEQVKQLEDGERHPPTQP